MKGPKVSLRVIIQCDGCEHLESKYYCIEDGNDCDSGFNHRCGATGRAVDNPSQTPESCPFLSAAHAKARELADAWLAKGGA